VDVLDEGVRSICSRITGPNTSYISGTELAADGGLAQV